MAYKPVSQNVTDNKNAEIPSSDAVFDKIQTEINTLFPTQSGNAGKFLTTDGDETSWDNVPASANPTLSNLEAPTAVNENLILDSEKIIFTNGASLPSFTQSSSDQLEAVFKQGVIVSSSLPGAQRLILGVNSYTDAGVWKSRGINNNIVNRLRLESGDGNFSGESGVNLYWEYGNGTTPSWITAFRVTVGNPGSILKVNSIYLGSSDTGTWSHAQNLLTLGDNIGLVGNYLQNRFHGGNIGTYLHVNHQSLGVSTARPPAVISTHTKDYVGFYTFNPISGIPNNTTTLGPYYNGNNPDIPMNVGDYIDITGLQSQRQITNVSMPDGLNYTLTLDGPVGDGIQTQGNLRKPPFLAFNSANEMSFEVSPNGQTKIKKGLVINSQHGLTGTISVGLTDLYIGCNATSAVTVNLPKAIDVGAGKMLIIKHETGANTVTITPYAGDTCDTASLSATQVTTLISNGVSRWIAI